MLSQLAPRGRKMKTKNASQIASSTATDSPATASAPRGPLGDDRQHFVVAAVERDVLAAKGGRDVRLRLRSSDVGMAFIRLSGLRELNAASTWAA